METGTTQSIPAKAKKEIDVFIYNPLVMRKRFICFLNNLYVFEKTEVNGLPGGWRIRK